MFNSNQTVQIGNGPPVTLHELRAAGIRWHPQTGLGPMPAQLPVTQEDRDQLGVLRNEKLKCLKKLAVISIVLSIVAMGVGLGAVLASAPEYNFPHSMGGGAIAGLVVILYAFLIMGMVREGKKTPTGDTTTSCFRTLLYCNMFYIMFFASLGATAVGLSGIWGTVDCTGRTPEDDTARFTINSCTPNTGTLLAMAVLTLLVGVVIFVLFLWMNCIVCCNSRAFGVKSNYEMFADYQEVRMQQMNMQAQQQYMMPQGQGQFVPQGQAVPQGQWQFIPHGQVVSQPQGYVPQPTAPLLPPNQTSGGGDGAPPSYFDVMNKEEMKNTQV